MKRSSDDLFICHRGTRISISLIVSHLDQSCFSGRTSAGSPSGSCRTAPATWSTPRRGACSVPRTHPPTVQRSNASSGLPTQPAGRRPRSDDGRIITMSPRHSTAAQREVASLCLYICCHHFCTSPFCAGVISSAHWPRRSCLLCLQLVRMPSVCASALSHVRERLLPL